MARGRGRGSTGRGGKSAIRSNNNVIGNVPTIPTPAIVTSQADVIDMTRGRGTGQGSIGHAVKSAARTNMPVRTANMPTIPTPTVAPQTAGDVGAPTSNHGSTSPITPNHTNPTTVDCNLLKNAPIGYTSLSKVNLITIESIEKSHFYWDSSITDAAVRKHWQNPKCVEKSKINTQNHREGKEVAAGTHTEGSISIGEYRKRLFCLLFISNIDHFSLFLPPVLYLVEIRQQVSYICMFTHMVMMENILLMNVPESSMKDLKKYYEKKHYQNLLLIKLKHITKLPEKKRSEEYLVLDLKSKATTAKLCVFLVERLHLQLHMDRFLAYYAHAMLTPAGVNYEVLALMEIRKDLEDSHNVLNWDESAVDPCCWNMVTSSSDKFVIGLLLQSNNMSGSIPFELGMLPGLKTINLSDNKDLSFNNLSGPVPGLLAKSFNILGNPIICATGKEPECNGTAPMPLSFSLNNPHNVQPSGKPKTHKVALAFGTSLACICLLIVGFGFFLWWRQKHSKLIFFDSNEQHHEEVCLGNLRRFKFKEFQSTINNFSSKNILGKGGFGHVYKGHLSDGIIVAVKRLKDKNAVGGDQQFQTEVAMISLAVHRNLLRLYGFRMTPTERLLVYPYMSNGSVASRLKGDISCSQTNLGLGRWGTRKGVALGAARGLLFLHEQCDPKIIHRDVKAANMSLSSVHHDYCEAVVGDFGLAKLLDHHDSHVTTAVRRTVGHIAPEYLSTGQSSDKTDVFGFGILLLELVTGQRALEFGKPSNQKGAMLDWISTTNHLDMIP
ncbi:Protein NSP-INTERACTING KINASE 1 [Capsicum baccatum]|uniref:Protein NSP-INTERACTING KINASE 1 n=1 Tax=Capsicum baccatum TaxID=33114 RepID=A0A2G2VH84_CAPBA|nr:Protein NSP-INTERACTING KINASE 1 [Capsicum baccatum]